MLVTIGALRVMNELLAMIDPSDFIHNHNTVIFWFL